MANELVQSYSITRRLITFFILTVVTMSLLAIAILYFNIAQRAKLDFENRSEDTIAYLSGSLSLPIWRVNDSESIIIAETVARGNSVAQLEIVDYSRKNSVFNLDKELDGQQLTKTKQIFYEKQAIGEVRMSFSSSSSDDRVRESLYVSILILSLVLITVVVVTYYIVSLFLKEPFKQLTNLVSVYANGNYEKSNLSIRSKEFQPIVKVLEQMGERIITQFNALQDYQQRLKDLAGELTRTEARERRVIATQLHDHIGQSLALMRIQLAAALKQTSGRKLESTMNDISSSLRQAVDDTRNIIYSLSSPTLNELGLSAAISEFLNDQLSQRYNLKTCFSDDKQCKPLDDDSRAILYRNSRELLMNVVKHARASNVSVMLQRVADNIKIVIEDDGVGLDELKLSTLNNTKGFGLFSIEESMKDIGGEMTIESKEDRGTRIILTAPLEDGKTKTA